MRKTMKTEKPVMATAVAIPPTAPHTITKRIGGTTYQVVGHILQMILGMRKDKIIIVAAHGFNIVKHPIFNQVIT